MWINLVIDILAAIALATGDPSDGLLNRPPQIKSKGLISHKMRRHIIGMSPYMITITLVFIFAGEYLIVEPEDKYKFDRTDSFFVYPGRKQYLNGDPLYEQWESQTDGNASRHFTWVFHFFILMQIWYIICARKIRDEINVFSGVCSNKYFIMIWLAIVALEFSII